MTKYKIEFTVKLTKKEADVLDFVMVKDYSKKVIDLLSKKSKEVTVATSIVK